MIRISYIDIFSYFAYTITKYKDLSLIQIIKALLRNHIHKNRNGRIPDMGKTKWLHCFTDLSGGKQMESSKQIKSMFSYARERIKSYYKYDVYVKQFMFPTVVVLITKYQNISYYVFINLT